MLLLKNKLGVQDESQQIRKILHTIPDPYKEVFMWRVFGELSFKEIGDLYSKTDNWACVTYHRARKIIQSRWRKSIMKRECSIVRDVLPLYFENMVSEDTAVFVKEHLENCSDCAAELECLKSGKKIDKAETSERENDTNVITAVKKKIAKRIFKIVGVVCLVFVVILSAILLYIGISYPVTKDSISLSTKTEGDYAIFF